VRHGKGTRGFFLSLFRPASLKTGLTKMMFVKAALGSASAHDYGDGVGTDMIYF
jgi:hypothetical protein